MRIDSWNKFLNVITGFEYLGRRVKKEIGVSDLEEIVEKKEAGDYRGWSWAETFSREKFLFKVLLSRNKRAYLSAHAISDGYLIGKFHFDFLGGDQLIDLLRMYLEGLRRDLKKWTIKKEFMEDWKREDIIDYSSYLIDSFNNWELNPANGLSPYWVLSLWEPSVSKDNLEREFSDFEKTLLDIGLVSKIDRIHNKDNKWVIWIGEQGRNRDF
jgi:hypothetical protein